MTGILRRLTTERAAVAILVMLLFAMACRPALDPDMWWHIRLGQQSLETGAFVYADSFSHSAAGQVHKNHSWLAQVVMALAWQAAGHLGMTLFVAALAVAGMLALYWAGGGSVYASGFALALGAACAAAFWSPRPQMFTFFFSALLMLLLRSMKREGGAPIWSLPLLIWLWANLHGGYIVAGLFIAGHALGEGLNRVFGGRESAISGPRLMRLCGWALLSLAVLPIHPLGLDVFNAPFETLGISGLREYIQEWGAPDFAQPMNWPLVILFCALLATSRASRRGIDLGEWLLVGGTLAMALVSARHVSLFVVAALPILCADLDALCQRKGWVIPRRKAETPLRAALNALLISLVALGTLAHVAHVTSRATLNEALALNYPVGAVEHLKDSQLDGRLFNSYNWGGYLLFNLPEYPVFIDGRADLHRDTLPDYVAAAFGAPAWDEIFARRDIGIALIETGGLLDQGLEADVRWRQIYRDALASVYALDYARQGSDAP